MDAHHICKTASELVGSDRQVTHGDKTINFQNTAEIWNAILNAKARKFNQAPVLFLDALDVANMLEAFKIARRYSGSHNLDDYIDGAGYAGCAGEVAERMAEVSRRAGEKASARPDGQSIGVTGSTQKTDFTSLPRS